ncbi:MAG: DUF456 domain-containing protein [Cyclobacteriaceae bacterium]|nr:DUF456 domain-containing protein [Cyclobacteriaceae bacterium]UYN87965.1 MAG: DUF456 domain-containing protein [Cyclobacteriaceae bacterium]
MDLLWTVVACGFMIAGIVGSVVPLLPGPPLSFVGLLILQLREQSAFTLKFLLIWLVIVIIIAILDYVVPIYGTKKFGGSKYGMWGCAIGLIAGLWFGPLGIITGPFIGAFVGEMIATEQSDKALKAAIGSFIGFVFSTLIKLIACFVMGWYFIKAL